MGRAIFVHLSVLCMLAQHVLAQQAVTGGTLSGQVEDQSSARVVGLPVDVLHVERNHKRQALTDSDGRFRFSYLLPGNYVLRIEDPRFAATEKRITLAAGQAVDLVVSLALAGAVQSVSVTGSVETLDVARTQIGEVVRPREIDSLPLNGRNYMDLALLVPGVSRTNTGAAQRFAETSAVPGTGISFAGQRNLNNTFLVDGLSANDDAAGLAGAFYSQEVVREFQVINSGGIAEFGRGSSGIVSITTKSGTNEWHGRLYGFLRNQRLDARHPFARSKDPLTQAQYGASAGGPLRRDNTFLFSNFEQTRRQAAGFVTITPANVAAINSALDSFSYRGARVTTGQFPTGFDTTNQFVRLDHHLNPANQLALRYSFYDLSSENARNVGALNDISRATGTGNRDHTFSASEVATLSPSVVNEVRVQFMRSHLDALPNDPLGPAINISGVANLGVSTTSPEGRENDGYELSDSISVQRRSHSLKAGADFLYNRLNIVFPGALAGVYSFSSIANLRAGQYITFQQAFGAPDQFQSNPNFGLFAQDEWRVAEKLTLNFGVRYDVQRLPSPIQTDTNNFAPRFGLAYAPGDRKTVIRAGYGLYYDRIPLRATSNALQRDGTKYKVALLAFGQAGAPVFPQQSSQFPAGQFVNITTIDPTVENSYAQHATLQIERQIIDPVTVSVGYQWLRSLHLIASRNINVPTAGAGVINLGRPDMRYGNISRYESSGDSYYNGLLVSVKARAASWGEFRLSYNLSKTIDNVGNFFFSSPQNNFNLRDDRGLSDNDQRHRLTIAGVFESPAPRNALARHVVGGWKLAPLFTYTSALPFNAQFGSDRNGDTNGNDRPAGMGRNTGRGFDAASFDVRLSRVFELGERWRLEAIAESFNVLNRTNFQLPNTFYGPGAAPAAVFGQPTAAGDPRQVQLGLRINF